MPTTKHDDISPQGAGDAIALRIIAGLRVPPGSNHSALATASAALPAQQGAIVGTPQFDKLSHFREIPEQLKKILSSRTLVQSKRLARLLSFVVEKEIAGNGSQLNEYLIGVEVYQRPSSFDPQIDTIVRTEARRLRSKLHQYYETEGIHDPILMEIPKGSYAPAFRERERGILDKESGYLFPITVCSRTRRSTIEGAHFKRSSVRS